MSGDDHDRALDAWWDDLDAAVLACLRVHGAMAPPDLGRHVGLSESAVASVLCLLAMEGKVRICLVEHATARPAAAHAA